MGLYVVVVLFGRGFGNVEKCIHIFGGRINEAAIHDWGIRRTIRSNGIDILCVARERNSYPRRDDPSQGHRHRAAIAENDQLRTREFMQNQCVDFPFRARYTVRGEALKKKKKKRKNTLSSFRHIFVCSKHYVTAVAFVLAQ